MRHVLLLVFVMIAAGCADSPDAPDLPPAAEAPDDLAALNNPAVETPLRREHVDVHRVTLAPGDSLAPHQGGERVVYALSDLALRLTADGEVEERTFAEGDVHHHGGGVHAVANVGDAPAEFLIFERRDGALPDGYPSDAAAAPLGDGATDEVVFEDDFAEVHRVRLEPGAQLPAEWGYAGIVYALSDYTRQLAGADGEERYEAGEVHYHAPGERALENVGDTVAEFLVVVFKD